MNTKRLKFEFGDIIKQIRTKAQVAECLYLKKTECSEKIIKSHSIQNNRILNRISENGKVFQIKAEEAIFTSDMSSIGRKTATTFTGFCNKHDNLIFKCIEEKNYEPGDKEQEFLFAYRAFAREYIIKKTAKNYYKELIKCVGYSPHLNGVLDWTEFSIRELNKIKNYFYQSLINKKFDEIETKTVKLDKEYPIAVSSIFAPEYDFNSKIINDLSNKRVPLKDLFFTIFPEENKTYVLFSFFKKESESFDYLDTQVLSKKDNEIIKKLNLLISCHCENFVYSPNRWKRISSKEKNKFINSFLDAVPRTLEPEELMKEPEFNLFF